MFRSTVSRFCTMYWILSLHGISWNFVEISSKLKLHVSCWNVISEIASQLAHTLAFITNSQRESKDNQRKSRLHHRRRRRIELYGDDSRSAEKHRWTGERWEKAGKEWQRIEKCAREKRNVKSRGTRKEAKCNFSVRRFFQRQGNHLCSSQRLLNSYHCGLYLLKNVYSISFTGTARYLPGRFCSNSSRTTANDGIGRKNTTRNERERGRSANNKFTMCIRPHFPLLLGKLHHENIKNTFQYLKKSLMNDVGPGVASILNNKFKVMFEIHRVIEIWRQIVRIIRRIV